MDVVAVAAGVGVAQLGRFGAPGSGGHAASEYVNLTLFSVLLALTWVVALGLQQSWDLSLVGVGAEEYQRVGKATAWVFGVLAALALLLHTEIARGYLVIALPVGLTMLVIGRHLLRRDVARRRIRGEYMRDVIVVGGVGSVVEMCSRLGRAGSAGYRVIAACVVDFDGVVGDELPTPAGSIPVLGDENSIEKALVLAEVDAVAVAAVERLGHERMRRLAWHLDSLDIDMIVVPGMTDIAGPRLKVRPIDDLPLFHIARPRHDGPSRYGKRCFDIVLGAIAVMALLPVMVAVAAMIKLDDGGPVFFKQVRVGQHGKPFRMFKFRTMIVDADNHLGRERDATGTVEAVFFKSAADSRITKIGRVLRRMSFDEIPQLFNVLEGSMSIVGPRPLVPGEGATVEQFIERRGLVKPGLTGLWQVSGRSDVSDEERIRLDHSYVDNWSFVADLMIVWRTARAVLTREGAY